MRVPVTSVTGAILAYCRRQAELSSARSATGPQLQNADLNIVPTGSSRNRQEERLVSMCDLGRCFRGLSPRQRRVLRLKYWEGRGMILVTRTSATGHVQSYWRSRFASNEACAHRLGLSPRAFRRQLEAARSALGQAIEDISLEELREAS